MLTQRIGVQCRCGGMMEGLSSREPFVLSENKTIRVEGICGKCHDKVHITWPLIELMFRCPIDKKDSH